MHWDREENTINKRKFPPVKYPPPLFGQIPGILNLLDYPPPIFWREAPKIFGFEDAEQAWKKISHAKKWLKVMLIGTFLGHKNIKL